MSGITEHRQRTPFICGNWKSEGFRSSINNLISSLNAAKLNTPRLVACVAPGHLHLDLVSTNLKRTFEVAAQDCSEFDTGAYTGGVAATQLRDFGVNWVILGHSERRRYHNDTDFIVAAKVKLAIRAGLRVIACVGETLEERKAGRTLEIVRRQAAAICDAAGEDFWSLILAYEPVWAIGTGLTASPQQAQDVHHDLRSFIAENYGEKLSLKMRIIYGGSVKPENASELYCMQDVDGFLVGGASLNAGSFMAICDSVGKHYEQHKSKFLSRL